MEDAMKKARELLEMVAPYELAEFEYSDELVRIKFSRGTGASPPPVAAAPVAAAAPAAPSSAATAPAPAEPRAPEGHLVLIHSPMVGTFYTAPAPDKPPYVTEGGVVEKGQVVCIIEAMKLMNEIKSPTRGRVVKILGQNASPVSKDEVLFHIDPT